MLLRCIAHAACSYTLKENEFDGTIIMLLAALCLMSLNVFCALLSSSRMLQISRSATNPSTKQRKARALHACRSCAAGPNIISFPCLDTIEQLYADIGGRYGCIAAGNFNDLGGVFALYS
jgi:hypothetical protein